MKATLNLAENTILMDCTPQELAGLLSLLQPRTKQGLPSSDHHPDEPPAAAEPVQEQDPEPEPQAPKPAAAEPVQEQEPEPTPQAPEPAPADHDLEQDPEPALQAPEPAPAEPLQDPEPSSQEPEPVIPPEPAEREPLGKAIERLKKEKTAGRPMKYQPVYARNDDGDTIYRDSVFELALALDVTAQTVHQAIKKGYRCKGYKIKFDDPQNPIAVATNRILHIIRQPIIHHHGNSNTRPLHLPHQELRRDVQPVPRPGGGHRRDRPQLPHPAAAAPLRPPDRQTDDRPPPQCAPQSAAHPQTRSQQCLVERLATLFINP